MGDDVVLLDSITDADPSVEGRIAVSGSHGGVFAAAVAADRLFGLAAQGLQGRECLAGSGSGGILPGAQVRELAGAGPEAGNARLQNRRDVRHQAGTPGRRNRAAGIGQQRRARRL